MREEAPMLIKTENDILAFVAEDKWMMEVLHAAKSLNLPDWWICAGFVRSKIWDVLHDFQDQTPLPDIDVIYFDGKNIDELAEKQFENQLTQLLPHIPWSVKNEARMHIKNDFPPYSSSIDAISKFPETVTALGLTLDACNNVKLAAPWGIGDVIQLKIKPTPFFMETEERMLLYKERIKKKNWPLIWNKVEVIE